MVKTPINVEKVKCDEPTDERTDGRTKWGVESRSTRLKHGRVLLPKMPYTCGNAGQSESVFLHNL